MTINGYAGMFPAASVLFDVYQVVVGVAVYEFVVGVDACSGGHLIDYDFEGFGGLGQADFL